MSLKTSSSQAKPLPQPGFTSSHGILSKARSIQQFAWLCCHLHNSSGSTCPWVTHRQKNSKNFPKFKVSLGFYAGLNARLTSTALSCSCVRCQRPQSLMEKMRRAAGLLQGDRELTAQKAKAYALRKEKEKLVLMCERLSATIKFSTAGPYFMCSSIFNQVFLRLLNL